MTLGCHLTQRAEVRQELRQAIGETSGDIPLYSLHRIKSLFRKQPPALSKELQTLLLRYLIAANLEYKEDTGHDWSCLTSHNLVDALEATDQAIREAIDGVEDIPKEWTAVRNKLFAKLHEGREGNVAAMKRWFESNFEALQYDMRGQIPYPVVLRLRRALGQWIAGVCNPFGQDIQDMVLEVAAEEGIATGNAEDAWEKMGGTVFTKKRS